MNRFEALESIKRTWNDTALPLDERAASISSDFYSTGLDLDTAAAYINATPSELEALLGLGGLDEGLLREVAKAKPPRTAWTFLNGASEEEVRRSLATLSVERGDGVGRGCTDVGEIMYRSMVECAEPTPEQKVSSLSGSDLKHALNKAVQYKADNSYMTKFMKSIAARRTQGKTLTQKQSDKLYEILNQIVDAGAIARDSIDGDAEICNRILDAMGR